MSSFVQWSFGFVADVHYFVALSGDVDRDGFGLPRYQPIVLIEEINRECMRTWRKLERGEGQVKREVVP